MTRTILLADDHEDNRAALIAVLEHDGYRTLEARNGREAVELVRAHRPDLVVMDLAMPVMDGLAAMRLLKDDPETAHIPIVAFTAMALTYTRADMEARGFDGFLTKPCMPPTFLQEVQRLVGGSSG